jgi:hypothetical protein
MDLRRPTVGSGQRASSTALDTVLFVVLVGVAVATLAGGTPGGSDAPRRVADETADVVATSTTEVTYTRRGSVTDDSDDDVEVSRQASGTYAELLAAALVDNPRLGEDSLTGSSSSFREAVANATRRALPTENARVQVRATWQAYPGAGLERTITAGSSPPRDADVAVATVTVPSGFRNATRKYDPAEPQFATLAGAISRSVVDGLFPPGPTADAMASEGPDRAVVASRYQTAEKSLGVTLDTELRDASVEEANEELVRALRPLVNASLGEEFDTASEATRATRVDRVRIVVRAWSP